MRLLLILLPSLCFAQQQPSSITNPETDDTAEYLFQTTNKLNLTKGGLGVANTWTADQVFNGNVSIGGYLVVSTSPVGLMNNFSTHSITTSFLTSNTAMSTCNVTNSTITISVSSGTQALEFSVGGALSNPNANAGSQDAYMGFQMDGAWVSPFSAVLPFAFSSVGGSVPGVYFPFFRRYRIMGVAPGLHRFCLAVAGRTGDAQIACASSPCTMEVREVR